jgi:hypothetical protein
MDYVEQANVANGWAGLICQTRRPRDNRPSCSDAHITQREYNVWERVGKNAAHPTKIVKCMSSINRVLI